MQARRFTLCSKTGSYLIGNRKTKWHLEPKSATLWTLSASTEKPLFTSWDVPVPSWRVRKSTTPNRKDSERLRQHNVIFKYTNAELMLHFFALHCVFKAHSAPGPWTHGWGTTAPGYSSVLMRPASLLLRFLARHLQSIWWCGVRWRTTAFQQMWNTGVCFSLLLWQDNDRLKAPAPYKSVNEKWKSPRFCPLMLNTCP